MKLVNKKALNAFLISFAVFALIALIFTLALSIGRNDLKGKPILGGQKQELEGESFNVLMILTDYAPEKFSDYDPKQVENVFGIKTETPNKEEGLAGYRKIFAEKMVIFRFDKENANITLTPISGNTLLTVKNVKTPIETLIGDFGTEFLCDKIRAMTGLSIDAEMVFTPQSAEKVLDLFGEINYTLKCKMQYKDDERGIDINLKSGSQKLNGNKAVQMLRFDDYEDTKTTLSKTYIGYFNRLFKKITDEYNFDQVCKIFMNIISYVGADYDEVKFAQSVRLFMQNEKLEIKELLLSGEEQTVGDRRYFVLDEKGTLENFKKYRNIKSNIVKK